MDGMVSAVPLAVSGLAFVVALSFTAWLRSKPAGDEKVRSISTAVKEGSKAFLRKELNYIALAGALIALLITMLIGPVTGVSFVVGACCRWWLQLWLCFPVFQRLRERRRQRSNHLDRLS